MKKKIFTLLFALLGILAQVNIASASGTNGYQPPVPENLIK